MRKSDPCICVKETYTLEGLLSCSLLCSMCALEAGVETPKKER